MHQRAMAASVAMPQCPAVPCSAAAIISGYTSRKSSRASAQQLRSIRPAGAVWVLELAYHIFSDPKAEG